MNAKPGWLVRIGELRPSLIEEAEKCSPRFQERYFALLVERALRDDSPPILTPAASFEHPQEKKRGVQEFPKFRAFLDRTGLELIDVGQMVELESGDVLVSNLGASNSEIQRSLAALLALRGAATEGSFRFSKSLLREQCQNFGVYDTNNFTAYMKKAEFGGARLFLEKGETWELTSPGLAFLETIVRRLRPKESARAT